MGWGEDGVHEVCFRGLQGFGHRIALDEFGDFGADHMGAEELTGFFVKDGFDQPLWFAQRNGFAVADKGKAAHFDFVASSKGSLLCQADAGHLRPTIGAAGDVFRVHRMQAFDARNFLNTDDPFMRGFVGEPWRAGEIANGIDPGHAGLAPFIDSHMAAIDFDACLLQT